jgi:hypothetical protein
MPTGYVITRPSGQGVVVQNKTRVYTRYANKENSKKVDDGSFAIPNDEKTLNTFAFKYFKTPKRGDHDAQLYFLMTSLLLLATSLIIVSSCGCLFYFLIKSVARIQHRIVNGRGGAQGGSDDEDLDRSAAARRQRREDAF